MDLLHQIFHTTPEIALFLSIAVGYWLGQIRFGTFRLGGVGGSLLAAVVISQVGVHIDDGVKAVMFAVFIYAVGYESGPQFFNSISVKTFREIALALFMAFSALATVVICAKLAGLNKGLAAGLAGGALTQSAIIGTAGDAIGRLGLTPAATAALQSDVAIGYAVTYVFGSLGPIVICVNLLPKLLGQSLRAGSIEAEKKLSPGRRSLEAGQSPALPDLVGREFRVIGGAGRTVAELELAQHDLIAIERITRAGNTIHPEADLKLERDDRVLIVGRRDMMIRAATLVGEELDQIGAVEIPMQIRRAVYARPGMNRMTISDILRTIDRTVKHGVFVQEIRRANRALSIRPDTELKHGDVIYFYGSPAATRRAVAAAGYELPFSDKTDFIYMSFGIVLGLLIGLFAANIGGIPLTLGSGGGCLLSGLLFGWLRGRHPIVGAMPSAASQLLTDFGLAAFVAVVGLDSGLQAVVTVRQNGLTIFLLGIVVTLLPMLLTMLFGRYVLRYRNVALLAGALAGARSANPAFGAVLEAASSTVPTVPFAITYALANVLLTLIGPLVVGLV